MLSNRLRHRISIQEVSESQNSENGAVSEVWINKTLSDGTVLNSVPAEVLTGAGKEFVQSGALQGEFNARINLRWFPELTLKMRVIWENTVYQITSIETDITARREYRLKVMAVGEYIPNEGISLVWNNTELYYNQ